MCGSGDVGSAAAEGFNEGCVVPSGSPHSTLKTDCHAHDSNGNTSRDSPHDPNKVDIRNLRSVLDKVHRHSDPVQVLGAQLLSHLHLTQSLFLKTLSCPDYLGFLRSFQCFGLSIALFFVSWFLFLNLEFRPFSYFICCLARALDLSMPSFGRGGGAEADGGLCHSRDLNLSMYRLPLK